MIETIVGDNGSRFIIAAAAVAVGLLCLVAVLWIMRHRPSSPFVRGGKNRQPRLAVLDAAAVDARRRLVLVRRDDVEHLVMIGGPTDIVIESRIAPDDTAPAETGAAEQKVAEAPKAAPRPEPRPAPAPAPVPAEATAAAEERPAARMEERAQAAAPRVEPAPPIRLAAEQRPAAAQPLQQQPPARVSPPVSAIPTVSAIERAEDIFDVARERVLPVAPRREQAPMQQGSMHAASAPAAQTHPMPIQPAASDRVSDFERILDAEISGDLQRLAPSVGPQAESRPIAGGRQEPLLGGTPDNIRKEPTIEEEMNRMLADISAGRKP
ncbi:flagellar biosynthetic protein FliO [Sinorhizobium garamanticum]|uniref:Flagellar biosynthetic protein FliO n=1 Tax=Sinorhizobium garamanticum TaxID=680247 RepID=A0ABY8DBQ0_9HYPH|nr:flagellar biosynthetic protein FliO [Sinorhizobium garamanticum]WEX86965.1 flagellar biosynthetic protein FliO [Sinorhizobium garamanticum]